MTDLVHVPTPTLRTGSVRIPEPETQQQGCVGPCAYGTCSKTMSDPYGCGACCSCTGYCHDDPPRPKHGERTTCAICTEGVHFWEHQVSTGLGSSIEVLDQGWAHDVPGANHQAIPQ